jgi:hypothetical protein
MLTSYPSKERRTVARDGAVGAGPARFTRALAGEWVEPPVTGVTFVDPQLLGAVSGDASARAGKDAPESPGAIARLLARVCRHERLDFAFVPSWMPWALEAVFSLTTAGVASAWVVPGVLWPALEAVGVADGLRAVESDPHALAEPFDEATLRALAAAGTGRAAGAAAVVVADDLAGAAGPLLGPAFLKAEVFPRLARIAHTAREREVPAILHCDGDVRTLMEAAAAAGFTAVHGDGGGTGRLESLAAARAAGLALIGGISTASLVDRTAAVGAGGRAHRLACEAGLLVSDDGGITTAREAAALLAALHGVQAGC